MRINWLSPLPPAKSEIAQYTARLLPVLRGRSELSLWTQQKEWEAALSGFGAVQNCQRMQGHWPPFSFADETIYHIGNEANYHATFSEMLRQHPGIVVLHDGNLHEMQRMRTLHHRKSPAEYLALLLEFGGMAAFADGMQHLDGALPIETMIERYPLTNSVVRDAVGVICHNPAIVADLRQATKAPVACLPLPFAARDRLRPVVQRSWDGRRPLEMVLFGFLLSPNRRLLPFLRAWATFPDRRRLRLTLFGVIDQVEKIQAEIRQLGLAEWVTVKGFLPEKEVESILDQADLAINLRFPSRGEASASQLRIWNHSLPSLVTRTSIYATFPEEAVAMVDPGREEEDIHRHLSALLENPETFYAMGRCGRAILEADHLVESYVDHLLHFVNLVRAQRGRAFLAPLLRHVSRDVLMDFAQPLRDLCQQKMARELAGWVRSDVD